MTNKCLRCNHYINVQFEFGHEIKYCGHLKLHLKDKVISCTEFVNSTPLKKVMEDWQLMEFVKTSTPYIIEEKIEAGFKGDKKIKIRPSTVKDRELE